ncbi:syntaxin-5 [Drosophila ficusphila]|uniref:syntaxin-5 n=1 Tax=Drosophila ficusphila TaxID=30025 RepID=UPI0007E6B790|nr:syntaxin-5 [Drosophila ficusphila]XP_017056509.1 syntaxin-5 [Drosophila ficusphila]
MQTRRRLHQTDQQDYSSSSTYTIQEDQQGGAGAGAGFGGTGAVGGSVGLTAQSLIQSPTAHEAAIHIGETNQLGESLAADYSDDKYGKAARQWNLRAFSGQALRTLSAAAAVVTGNQPGINNNNSQSNYSYPASSASSSQLYQPKEEHLEPEPEPEIFVMAGRDRTGEFANAIRSLQARNITRAVNIRDPRKAKQVQSYSEFMMVARFIGKNIASTYAKLEKLTMLAKKKSLFDDRPQEIQELTYIIKGDLNALNQQIARLQDISKDQRRHTNGKHLVSHSSNMVLALQSKLASMSTDFKQILEVRTENLKQQKTRRDQFSQGPGPLAAHTVSPSTAKQGSLLLSEENQAVSIDMGSSDTTPLLSTQTQMAIYDDSDNYVQQRAETMQNIESTIVELGGIFQQLAHMVKEQEEIVERIDTNVADAELNIEAAHGEILKYFQSVSKNRWLMIKIFGVLIFFFLFFVVFMS